MEVDGLGGGGGGAKMSIGIATRQPELSNQVQGPVSWRPTTVK